MSKLLKEKGWQYEQYYLGDKDKYKRRNGNGENHWSSAQSLEWYVGHFVHDTMHGTGDYHWRHKGPGDIDGTYEGHFFCNCMHGYGTMSYPDGRTFSGLYFNNMRWGPGVESHARLRDDVGLWRGNQLVRLAWRPEAPSILPEFMTTNSGRTIVENHRIIFAARTEIIGDTNSALELLKQCGADPRTAVNKWHKLYPKYSTDLASPLCRVEIFDQDFYNGKINILREIDDEPANEQIENAENVETYFAWNNNVMMVNMMKHCFKHETQRSYMRIDLKSILSGPRKHFKPAGNHELDCRTLLMVSYLGHVSDVAILVNESNVHPDVSDVQGNTAIMYASCGNQPEVINFLLEAGANIDFCNDACCTPLGVALLHYICAEKDIAPAIMLQALTPPTLPPNQAFPEPKAQEWHLVRDVSFFNTGGIKSPTKIIRNMSSKKIKSLLSLKDQPMPKKKNDSIQPKVLEPIINSEESISEEKRLYDNVCLEYSIRVTDVFTPAITTSAVSYIFEICDMVKEIEDFEEDQKKPPDKNPKKVTSKVIKDTVKTSKEALWQSNEKEIPSIDSIQKSKIDKLGKIMSTILVLLSDGANPNLARCPKPALFMAAISNCPDLVRHLVHFGAKVNETYDDTFGYSSLDIAVSRPFSYESLEVIRALLECGANPLHRLLYNREPSDVTAFETQTLGPTLLHAVLAKQCESDTIEDEICQQLLSLLLEYNCNPIIQFKGRSAIDVAMSKSLKLLEIFIKSPKTNLNAVINKNNQSILVKMFFMPFFRSIGSSERLQTFTNLLLFGADPLIECRNGEDIYANIFVFTKKTLMDLEAGNIKPDSSPTIKQDPKAKKNDKTKKDEKLSMKSTGKMAADDVEDYKQAIELVTDCARLIYIRWLQASLMNKIVSVIQKYKHRHWNNILKEIKEQKTAGLWLTPQRCLEIWDILSNTKRKKYYDKRIIKHLLCIVIFMSWKNFGHEKKNNAPALILTADLKSAIEFDAIKLLNQHEGNKKKTSDFSSWRLSYIKPELDRDDKKFNICFECALPLSEDKILCSWCKLISFCSCECIKININRVNCHPCSDYIKRTFFSGSVHSVLDI